MTKKMTKKQRTVYQEIERVAKTILDGDGDTDHGFYVARFGLRLIVEYAARSISATTVAEAANMGLEEQRKGSPARVLKVQRKVKSRAD